MFYELSFLPVSSNTVSKNAANSDDVDPVEKSETMDKSEKSEKPKKEWLPEEEYQKLKQERRDR